MMNQHSYLYETDGRDGVDKRQSRERSSRSPRVFAAGDLKLLLLELIGEQPRHGYGLIQYIEALFDGAYSPSPGIIYPTLACLEAANLIDVCVQGDKKCYSITDTGRLALAQQEVALDGVRMRIEVSRRSLCSLDRPAEIHEAVHNLRHALQLHSGLWSPTEIERVHNLLNNTAKAIVDGPAGSDSATLFKKHG